MASGGAITLTAVSELSGRAPGMGRTFGPVAALLGLPLATYTAVLLGDTAVPVWHEAGRELPFVFAGSAAASAGAAATGGAMLPAGSLSLRWAVFRAGFRSAADPRYTVGPQRRRMADRVISEDVDSGARPCP